MLVEGKAGPVSGADGAFNTFRLSRDSSQVVQDGHGRYLEATARGAVFTASLAAAGVTSTGTTASPLSAGGTALYALYNPPGSGKNLAILRAYFYTVSGTVAGPVVWNAGPTAAITQATTQAIVSNSVAQPASSVAKAFGNVALTGSSALSMLRPFFGSAATTVAVEETAGDIVVGPGSLAALTGTGAGTTWIYVASLTWEEVSI